MKKSCSPVIADYYKDAILWVPKTRSQTNARLSLLAKTSNFFKCSVFILRALNASHESLVRPTPSFAEVMQASDVWGRFGILFFGFLETNNGFVVIPKIVLSLYASIRWLQAHHNGPWFTGRMQKILTHLTIACQFKHYSFSINYPVIVSWKILSGNRKSFNPDAI